MNHLSIEQEALLILLRRSLWEESAQLPEQVDWEKLDTCAKQQGVISLAFDGAVAMGTELPDEIQQKWNKKTLFGVVMNERLLAAQDQVLGWLEKAGIPAVVLKGSSVAQYYPQPVLRVLGDIDVLVPREKVDRVKEIMLQNGYAFHESEHEFHLGFSRPGAYVEIHYEVTTLPNSRGGQMAQQLTAQFLDHRDTAGMQGHVFPILTESNQALMLLLHMVRHMLGEGIGLRQLCDWAMYITSVEPKSFAERTAPMLERCGLLRYAQVATQTCVHYLGLPENYATWCTNVTQENTQAFIQDIFFGGNMGTADSEKISRLFSYGDGAGKKQSMLRMLITGLTRRANYNFPITKKHKWLLPLFWVFIPIRYWVRSLFGLRQKKSFAETAKNTKLHQQLYDMLKIFEINE